jgi:hypothetical protein
MLKTAEYTEDGSTFVSMPSMPKQKFAHCMAVLECGNIFVAGGHDQSCFLYKKDQNKWKRCPDIMRQKRFASCGVIKKENGKEEVVVAGSWDTDGPDGYLDTVDIFSFEETRWREGIENKLSKSIIFKHTYITVLPSACQQRFPPHNTLQPSGIDFWQSAVIGFSFFLKCWFSVKIGIGFGIKQELNSSKTSCDN